MRVANYLKRFMLILKTALSNHFLFVLGGSTKLDLPHRLVSRR